MEKDRVSDPTPKEIKQRCLWIRINTSDISTEVRDYYEE